MPNIGYANKNRHRYHLVSVLQIAQSHLKKGAQRSVKVAVRLLCSDDRLASPLKLTLTFAP